MWRINQAEWWIITLRLMIGIGGAHGGLIAGKPAPTGFVVALDTGYCTDNVGAGLPAMRPVRSPLTQDQLINPASTNNPSSANKSGTLAT